AAIASASLSLLLARWITRALQSVNLAAEKLAQGSFSQPVQTSPITEVNELGQSFNNMARQLLASLNQLEDYNGLLEAQFDAFFKLAPVGMAILDSQLRYVQVNDILATINGPSVEEHLGRTIDNVIPDLAPVVAPLYRQILRTGTPILNQEVSGTVPSQPGVVRQWLCSYFPLDGSNGRPSKIGIVLVEISNFKRVEEALRVSEQKFSTIFHVSPDPAWIATFPEGLCLNVNDRLCKFLGYSREEMVGQYCESFNQWDQPEHIHWFQTQLLQNGSVEEFETVFRIRTGELRTVLLSAQVCRLDEQDCIIGVLKDISDRKQAEAVLQQSEAQIRAILEAIPDLIMRIDRQGFYRGYVRTNSLIDLIPAESDPVGHHLSEYRLPERGARQLQAIQQVLDTGEMQVYEQEMVFDDRIQYEELRIVVYDADEVLVLIRDITDRKQLELALQESQTRLSDILNRAIAAIVSYRLYDDIKNTASRYADQGYSTENWSYEFCSSGCERVFGYTPDELMAYPPLWYEHVHPEDWQQVLLPRYAQLMSGEAITSEYRFLDRDGTWRWISETAACRRDAANQSWIVTIVSHDISDRKRSEEKLRYSEAALAKAQSIAQMGSWEFDPITQHITWSEELFRIYGLDPSQPVPDYPDFLQLLPPSDRQRMQECVYQALTAGQSYEIEHQFFRADGMIGWIFGRGEVLRDDQGQVIKLFGTGQDITARKHIELELQQSKEAAEAANRSKSLFLANISHELRTPLNAILGFAELMSFDPALSADQRENLNIIRRSGDHLLTLINDVLDLSKIEAGRMILEERVVVVATLLSDLQQLFQPQASDRDIQLSFQISPSVPPAVILDERKLRQILINLLGNALKFTPQGRVTVRLSTVPVAKRATLDPSLATSSPVASSPVASPPQPESVQLLWEIEDTGVGIAPNELDSIFEAFAQAQAGRQTEQGTGLGLAISQRFARLMGGNLSVRSTVGQGSTFTLHLPGRVVEEAIASPPPSIRQSIQLAPGQPTYRILVVDDHPLNRRLLVKLLFRAGLEVKVAADG
ncbi:MAG TPA: PAS domain S-box protein, partial [Chroococcidiopsis sp.]